MRYFSGKFLDIVGQNHLAERYHASKSVFIEAVVRHAAVTYLLRLWKIYHQRIKEQSLDLLLKREGYSLYWLQQGKPGSPFCKENLDICLAEVTNTFIAKLSNPKLSNEMFNNFLTKILILAFQERELELNQDSSLTSKIFEELREDYLEYDNWTNKKWAFLTISIGRRLGKEEAEKDKYLPLQTIEKNLGLLKLLNLTESPVFSPKNLGCIDSSLVSKAVIYTSIRSKDIEKNIRGEGEYFFEDFPELKISINLTDRNSSARNPLILAFTQAKKVAEQIDSKVAIAHLILSAFAQEQNWQGSFCINHRTIADLMWRDATRSTKNYINQINQTLLLLNRMHVHIQTPEFECRDILWQIGTYRNNKEGAFFKISPGGWAEEFQMGCRSFITNKVFHLRKDSAALKIGLILLNDSRIYWTARELIYQSLGTLKYKKNRFKGCLDTLQALLKWNIEYTEKNCWLDSVITVFPDPLVIEKVITSPITTSGFQHNSLALQVKKYCDRNHITAQFFASCCGVSPATLSRLKNGQGISRMTQKQISRFLNSQLNKVS